MLSRRRTLRLSVSSCQAEARCLRASCMSDRMPSRREVDRFARTTEINPEVRRYLNRLSDYFFVTARANVHAGIPDVEYERSGKVFR